MPAMKKIETQERTAQLGIKVNATLYEKYKAKLKEDNTSITESIENFMRSYVGEVIIQSNVVDINKMQKDVEELKQAMGEWQERMSNLNVS